MSGGNIVLVGMPGAGKSTVGVLLAKSLSRGFIDTDIVIQTTQERQLHEIIATEGHAAFRRIEEACILQLSVAGQVIATGGSVIYSDAAMRHLKKGGIIVWLRVPVAVLARRLGNLTGRGVVMAPGQSLDELAAEREPLYAAWSDLTIDCGDADHEGILARLFAALPPL